MLCIPSLSLNYSLAEYIDQNKAAEIPALSDGRFPDDLQVQHCLDVWREALDVANKATQD